jgi:motility quorum-sensing regulator / GCU-specific mRNA interferase toxin
MRKARPHYDLAEVKAMVSDPSVDPFTVTAKRGGLAMGLTPSEMRKTVLALSSSHFYKSMTTYGDHRVWQDVYHGVTPDGHLVYIKITGCSDGGPPVIQFKAK